MKNNYRVLDSCLNCTHSQPIGDYSGETTYHCTKWQKLLYLPSLKETRNMFAAEWQAVKENVEERFKETQVLPNGICDDYKGK